MRTILITAAATILALIPLALSSDDGLSAASRYREDEISVAPHAYIDASYVKHPARS